MDYTFIERVTSTLGERRSEASFDTFATWLLSEAAQLEDKKKGHAWSPTLFKTGRLQRDAESISALVLDFDQPANIEVLQKLGLQHIYHSTYTHPGSRVVIALSRPVLATEWEGFWLRAVEAFGFSALADPACKNVGRIYFTPAAPMGQDITFQTFEGEALPVDELLSSTEDLSLLRKYLMKVQRPEQSEAIRLALAGKPMAQEGNRDNTVTGLGFYLGKFVVPNTYSVEAVTELLRRGFALPGTESPDYWASLFKKGFLQGREEKTERTEESKTSLGLDKEWAAQLQTRTSMSGDVSIMSNTHNAFVILSHEGTYSFRENLLEGTMEFRKNDEGEYAPFDDVEATHVCNWLQRCFKVTLSRLQVFEQVQAVARMNAYDPPRAFLLQCKTDGTVNLDTFLTKYMGCDDTPLVRIYSRRWLIGLVARALRPGCKMDDILTLQGAQGLGKSTAFRLLTEPWFSDSKIIIGDKDSYALAASSWVHECAELASLKRADLELMKGFFSSPEDTYRPVWARTHVKKPRRCVFVATTNQDEFLKDDTGNRRWWVARCTRPIDFGAIGRDRESILAEAVKAFRAGERWHLTPEEKVMQEEDLEQYLEGDGMEAYKEAVHDWWHGLPKEVQQGHVTVSDIVTKAWSYEINQAGVRSMAQLAGRVLKSMGFVKFRPRINGESRVWAWRVPMKWWLLREAK